MSRGDPIKAPVMWIFFAISVWTISGGSGSSGAPRTVRQVSGRPDSDDICQKRLTYDGTSETKEAEISV
jgi:hypothetical protein